MGGGCVQPWRRDARANVQAGQTCERRGCPPHGCTQVAFPLGPGAARPRRSRYISFRSEPESDVLIPGAALSKTHPGRCSTPVEATLWGGGSYVQKELACAGCINTCIKPLGRMHENSGWRACSWSLYLSRRWSAIKAAPRLLTFAWKANADAETLAGCIEC